MWAIENHIEFTAACAVYMDDYNATDAQYAIGEIMRPYTIASMTCAQAIMEWADEKGINRDEIAYIFEKGDNDQDDLRRCWGKLLPNLRVDPVFLRKVDTVPGAQSSSRVRPFEAADFLAYENLRANQKLQEAGDAKVYFDQLRAPIRRMRNLPGSPNWRFLDQSNLVKICKRWNIPLRPVTPSSA
jgi:hypothetical protein